MKGLLGLIAAIFALNVQAVPVRWELPGNDGFTGIVGIDTTYGSPELSFAMTGSFVYDADTNTYSDIELFFDGSETSRVYSASCSYGNNNNVACPDNSSVTFAYVGAYDPESGGRPQSYYRLVFDSPLTNSGESVSILSSLSSPNVSQYIVCDWLEGCEGGIDTHHGRLFMGSGGTINGSVVPIPAAVWLFGSGLAGLGFARRKAQSS